MAQAQAWRVLRATIASAIVGALFGCGGGESSGLLGGGQGPDPAVQDFPLVYVKRPLLLDDMGALIQFEVRDPNGYILVFSG